MLPALTPPATMMLRRLCAAAARDAATVAPVLGSCTSRSWVTSIWPCRRIDTDDHSVTSIVAVSRAPED